MVCKPYAQEPTSDDVLEAKPAEGRPGPGFYCQAQQNGIKNQLMRDEMWSYIQSWISNFWKLIYKMRDDDDDNDNDDDGNDGDGDADDDDENAASRAHSVSRW